MSVQTEIDRISGNVASALSAVAEKGVDVPETANSDSLPDLISQIETGTAEHSHSWEEITDKPSTFPPEEHTHTASEIRYFGEIGTSGSATSVGLPIQDAVSTHATSIKDLYANLGIIQQGQQQLAVELSKKVTAFNTKTTLTADLWIEENAGVWTQEFAILALTENDHLVVDVDPGDITSSDLTVETVELLKARVAAFALIDFIIPTQNGGIIFICLNKPPTVDIPIVIRVVA